MDLRHLFIILIASSVLLFVSVAVHAWPGEKSMPITPYGDFCLRCSHYGVCKAPMSLEVARKAIRDYYHQKGFDTEIENIKGRFIKAKIKDDMGKVVDVIIFDRRTGRVRSIY